MRGAGARPDRGLSALRGPRRGLIPAAGPARAPLPRPPDPEPPPEAARYDALHAGRTADVAFYAAEAECGGGPVLEVGCGTARVALAIAAAGIEVTGLDRSGPLLAGAAARRRQAARGVAARLSLLRADMRAYGFRRPFAQVVLPFRAFQAMIEVEDQLAALAAARAALVPGGRLVLDLFDPRLDVLAEAAEGPAPLAATGRGFEDARGAWRERVAARYDLETQIVDLTYVYERLDEGGRIADRAFERLRVRYFTRWEFEHLLARAGYEVEALYGGWDGEPPSAEGEDMIWIARRRDR